MKPRPVLNGWIVLPHETLDGMIRMTPECRNRHPYIARREMDGQQSFEWRGDIWMVFSCKRCQSHAFGYLSTGSRPLVHMFDITQEQSQDLLRLDVDTTAAEVMFRLGYAEMPAAAPKKEVAA